MNTNSLLEYTPKSMTKFKIIPDYEVENTNNIAIAQAFSNMYETPRQRINLKKLNIYYQVPKKAEFNILLEHKKAGFHLSVDKEYKDLIEGKMKTAWNKSNISETDMNNLSNFKIYKTEVCELILKDYNFKSLNTDRGNLYPLTNMLGIVRDLKEDEKVRVFILIEPIKRSNWVTATKDEMKEYKKGKVVNNEMTTSEKLTKLGFSSLEAALNMYIDYKMILFESIFGVLVPDKHEEKEIFEIKIDSLDASKKENSIVGLNPNTVYKLTSTAFKTRLIILSESEDKNRAKINMLSVANSYKDLTGDNELVIKLLSRSEQDELFLQVMDEKVTCSKKCILSDKEVAKLIQLPQRDLQKEYKIENIDTREMEVPKELTDGGIPIGRAELKGKTISTNWCNDYNSMALPKIVGGPPGSGKSNYTINFIAGANKLGHCLISFDYIKDCELTKGASKRTKNNVIIDLSNVNNLPSFSYPEMSYKLSESSTPFERMEIASDISKQIVYLINSITDSNTGPLTSPMIRYLKAAARVVFIHEGETLDNCLKVLEDWKTRQEYIRKTKGIYDYNDRVLNTLRELNELDEDGKIIGTRSHLITGVLNRIDRLQDDPRLELMLKAKADNYNFTQYMNEGKSVYIKMPQDIFRDKTTKDIIVTYFMTRIIMACYERSKIDKPNICHIIVDEVHQIPTAAALLEDYITEFRKFGIAPYFTVHYLKQFKSLLDAVKSSGASYMLLNGLEKENLMVLREEIQPFTIEEAMNLKEWESLNIIKHNNKYSRFISKMSKAM